MLDAGRRAAHRRRTAWGGAVAGAAVVAIAVGAAALPRGNAGSVDAAASSRPSLTSTGSPSSSASTETSWPNGQTDRTQTNGPRADKGRGLVPALGSKLPAGWQLVEKNGVGGLRAGLPLQAAQAQFAEYAAGGEVWEYSLISPVVRTGSDGVGKVRVQIETKGSTRIDGPFDCATVLASVQRVESGAVCAERTACGERVLVVTGGSEFAQVAYHRHADGTLVGVAQNHEYQDAGLAPLDVLPLTVDQLAAAAVSPEFHLD